MTDFSDESNQVRARALQSLGFDRTPKQVGQIRKDALEHMRKKLATRGVVLPEGDIEACQFLSKLLLQPGVTAESLEAQLWELLRDLPVDLRR